MLSFFRSKSTESQVSEITVATENMKMQSSESEATATTSSAMPSTSDLLSSLGYNDATELRDTIYGMGIILSYCVIRIQALILFLLWI